MYSVALTRKARRFFEKADADLQRRLDDCFEKLGEEPVRRANVKSLRGEFAGCYRMRVGTHRIVYRVDHEGKVVIVIIIAHRRDVYR